jgi:predicted nucleic acid-binding protein
LFANRFTAFIDACVLVGAMQRNLLLSLAEANFFRVRWSDRVLDETERAIVAMLEARGDPEARDRAGRACAMMRNAFEDACVQGWEKLEAAFALPDPGDAHVLAAAVATRASILVTDNMRDFPREILDPLGIEVKTADAFIADTIDLDPAKAVVAVRRMRMRLQRPEKTPEALFKDMEARGLVETVDVLRSFVDSL